MGNETIDTPEIDAKLRDAITKLKYALRNE